MIPFKSNALFYCQIVIRTHVLRLQERLATPSSMHLWLLLQHLHLQRCWNKTDLAWSTNLSTSGRPSQYIMIKKKTKNGESSALLLIFKCVKLLNLKDNLVKKKYNKLIHTILFLKSPLNNYHWNVWLYKVWLVVNGKVWLLIQLNSILYVLWLQLWCHWRI